MATARETPNGATKTNATDRTPRIVWVALAAIAAHTFAVFRVGAFSGPLDIPTWTALCVVVSVFWATCALLPVAMSKDSIAWARSRKARSSVWLIVLGVPTFGYLLSPGGFFCHPLAAYGFRCTVAPKMQKWALQLINTPYRDLPLAGDPNPHLAESAIPDWLKDLHKAGRLWVRYSKRGTDEGTTVTDRRTSYLIIGWDEDWLGWGFVVGPETLNVRPKQFYKTWRVAPGIYRWN